MGSTYTSDSDSNIPILIWIDKNVDNNENKKYIEKMINNFKYKFYGFDSVSKAIDALKKLNSLKHILYVVEKLILNLSKNL